MNEMPLTEQTRQLRDGTAVLPFCYYIYLEHPGHQGAQYHMAAFLVSDIVLQVNCPMAFNPFFCEVVLYC